MMKTADPELMRAINRYHVIDCIRRDGPIARVQIAERTELSRATVSAITGALIEEGLVRALAIDPNPSLGRGRPRVLLDLEAGACTVAGVRIGPREIAFCLADARAEPLVTLELPIRAARHAPEGVADLVEDGIRRCLSDAGLDGRALAGIGIGLPGVVDGVAGVSHASPVLGPAPVAFASMVERRLGAPTLIDTDANLVLVAEHWFGLGRNEPAFAVVTVEETVGMGLMIDGRPHRGAHGVGPQLGHLTIDPSGPPCACGRPGCLDAHVGEDALLRAAAAQGLALAVAPGQAMAELSARAEAGDGRAAAVLHGLGTRLGLALAQVVTLFNPPLLILSGAGLRAVDHVWPALTASVARHANPTLLEATRLVHHPWHPAMWPRGAASLALRRLFEAPWAGAPARLAPIPHPAREFA